MMPARWTGGHDAHKKGRGKQSKLESIRTERKEGTGGGGGNSTTQHK